MARPDPPRIATQFQGAALKWVLIAEPEFRRKHIDLDDWVIVIAELGDTIGVYLERPEDAKRPGLRGGGGFTVEISKQTMKVTSTYYAR